MDEERIEIYKKWAKAKKKNIARKIVTQYPQEDDPSSVFMAGSPGAGKTESARSLIISSESETLHIDPDEYRNYFDDYRGNNSHLFQGAVSLIAERVHDEALYQEISFVFDSTASNQEKMQDNIKRSLSRGRSCFIVYVYQDPLQAWDFVQKREELEGRKIRIDDFVYHYFSARDSVNALKKMYGKQLQVDLVVKDIDGNENFFKENVSSIDSYVPEKYNIDQLKKLLC